MSSTNPKVNVVFNYFGQGWVAVMNFAFIPVYIRYIGIEAYGLVGILATLHTILGILDMGLTLTLNREFASSGASLIKKQNALNLFKSIEAFMIITCVIIFLVIYLFSGWLSKEWISSHDLTDNQIESFFIMCGIIIALRLIEGIYKSVLVGLQRQIIYNLIMVILSTLRAIGAVIVLIYIEPSIQAFFIWQVIISIISVATWYFLTYMIVNVIGEGATGKFSFEVLRVNARYSIGILGMSILSLFITNLDKIFLPSLINLSDYGFYALASTLCSVLILMVGPVVQAAFPRLSEFHASRDLKSFANVFHKSSQLITIIIASASSIMIFKSNLILEIWIEDNYIIERTSTLLVILTIGTLLNCLMWIPYQVALASGHPFIIVKLNLLGIIIISPLFFWIVPLYGSIGAAWVWVLCNIYFLTFGCYLIFKKLVANEMKIWIKDDVVKPLSAIFIAVYFLDKIMSTFEGGKIMNIIGIMFIFSFSILVGILSTGRARNYLKDALNKYI
jgi:O-antigen/teichoic acid export membrane protein